MAVDKRRVEDVVQHYIQLSPEEQQTFWKRVYNEPQAGRGKIDAALNASGLFQPLPDIIQLFTPPAMRPKLPLKLDGKPLSEIVLEDRD